MIEVEFQHALVATELKFVRNLLHDLKTGQLSGIKFWRRMHELRAAGASPQEIDETLRAEDPSDWTWMEEMPDQP
jgi:hypothetical protein